MTEQETPKEKLARLEQELKDLSKTFPEHCYGTKGYIGVHGATPKHYQMMEDLEEEIRALKKELGES